MGIRVEWYNKDRHILLNTFEPGWTVADYVQSRENNLQMMREAGGRVDIVAYMPGNNIPAGMISQVRTAFSVYPPKTHVVVVDNSPLVRMLVSTFINLNPATSNRFHIASDVEEAEAVIDNARRRDILRQRE